MTSIEESTVSSLPEAPKKELLYMKYISQLSEEQVATTWFHLAEAGLVPEQTEEDDKEKLAELLQDHAHVDVVLALEPVEDSDIVKAFMSRPLTGTAPVDRQGSQHIRPNGSRSGAKKGVASSKPVPVGSKVRELSPKADDQRVVSKLTPNPKRAGSASHTRYSHYAVGISVADFIKAGGTAADVKWDLEHGFIELVSPEFWAASNSAPSDSAPSDSAPSDSAPSDSAPSDSAPSDSA